MSWAKELAKAMRDNAADEPENTEGFGGDQDGEDEDEEEYTPAKKGISGTSPSKNTAKVGKKKVDKYCPAENGETTNDGGEADVDDPDSIDKKTGGGSVKFASGKGTAKSLKGEVSEETADAIDVSAILGDLTKGIENLANAGNEQVADAIEGINKGLALIGKALAFSIHQNGAMLKGLAADVEEMGSRPAKRTAALKVTDKSFAGNERADDFEIPSRDDMIAKSMQALREKKINVQDAAKLEAAYNRGELGIVKSILKKMV